ncbi:hypothetical protein AVEN_73458-1 [Araneus ventricosus]|uniref:Uncharacterized protein n=1 Tax=Araneus ventricosus TaxID=182803 RepID=A0A4Y2Q9N3_ARAVE|nr:hypothetical protein AVEN_73458-1 [Araneus ventricosus]
MNFDEVDRATIPTAQRSPSKPRWPSGKVSILEPDLPGSKSDSTEDPSSIWAWCMLNLISCVKCPPFGVVRKFREGCPLRCGPGHLHTAQNDEVRPETVSVCFKTGC